MIPGKGGEFMRDIPVFTTENGAASLILKQIPYKKEAYVRLLDSRAPEALLKECVDFCVAAGAQQVYGTGHDDLTRFPLHTVIVKMCRPLKGMPQTDGVLIPVEEKTFDFWRSIYNRRMNGVPGAATVTMSNKRAILDSKSAYFVYRSGNLLGIGKAAGGQIDAVASLVPGAGRDILLALCNALHGDTVSLEVARNNAPAVGLYERLGFAVTAEVCRWYTLR